MKYLLAALGALASGVSLSAQFDSGGTIRGYVRDAQSAVMPGVRIVAVATTGLLARETKSDARGFFRLNSLPPGLYTVTVERAGFSTAERHDVEVGPAADVVLDVIMRAAGLRETVEVVAPRVEIQRPRIGMGLDVGGDTLREIPLGSRRDWSDVLQLTPGVVSLVREPIDANSYSLYGVNGAGHVMQVDGFDVGSFFSSGTASFSTSALGVAGASVRTAGLDASAPIGIGIVLNVITQSGTDRATGAVEAFALPARWNSRNGPGTSSTEDHVQADLAGSGPLLKGRVWTFGSYRFIHRTSGVSRSARDLSDLAALAPGFQPFDNVFRTHYRSFKVTVQAGSAHRVEAAYHRDFNRYRSGGAVDALPFFVSVAGGTAAGLSINSAWTPALVTRLTVSFNEKSMPGAMAGISASAPSRPVYASVFRSAGRLVGTGLIARLDNIPQWVAFPNSRLTLQGDVALYRSGGMGVNALKTGIYLQPRLRVDERTLYVNGGFTLEEMVLRDSSNPAAGYLPFHRTVVDESTATNGSSAARDYAVYVQDTWTPNSRVTVGAGVRLDSFRNTDRLSGRTFHDSLNIGPRFHGAYALAEDGATMMRASWGRVHDMPQSRALAPPFQVPSIVDTYDTDLDGVFDAAFVTPRTNTATNREYDPSTHLAFTDEWTVDVAHRFSSGLRVDAGLIRRRYRHRPALIETNAVYDGPVFVGVRDESVNSILRVTNNVWNEFVYSGLQATANYSSGTFGVFATYTRSFQHAEGTWAPNDPAGFIQPNAFPNNRGTEGWRDAVVNSLGTFVSTNNAFRTHNVRVAPRWSAPAGIYVAALFAFDSGPYSGPILTRVSASDARFGPATLRLSDGRLVSNPLATTVRFAFPTRGENQIQAPFYASLNLKVSRRFRLAGGMLEPSLDVYNITNRGAHQLFLPGGNHLFSPNYAIAPNGEFRGQLRQPPRAAMASLRWTF